MNDDVETIEFMNKWVNPYYGRIMGFNGLNNEEKTQLVNDIRDVLSTIDDSILIRMLSDSNWRPRLAAGCFIGLEKFENFAEKVGENLLKYPNYAYMYCFALGRIGTTVARDHLIAHLTRYLKTSVAQDYDAETLSVGWALSAIKWIDDQQQTNYFGTFYPNKWNEFVQANIDFYPDKFGSRDLLNQRWNLNTIQQSFVKWMNFAHTYFD